MPIRIVALLFLLVLFAPVHATARPVLRPTPPGCVEGYVIYDKLSGANNTKTLAAAGTWVQVGASHTGGSPQWDTIFSSATLAACFEWGVTSTELNVKYLCDAADWEITYTLNGFHTVINTGAHRIEAALGHSADTVHDFTDIVDVSRSAAPTHDAGAGINHTGNAILSLSTNDYISVIMNDSEGSLGVHSNTFGSKLKFEERKCT